jgi:hypothetical protein
MAKISGWSCYPPIGLEGCRCRELDPRPRRFGELQAVNSEGATVGFRCVGCGEEERLRDGESPARS